MKQMLLQYSGLKKELYILFIGKLVTAMGSFVWPMLTFLMTTRLGFSDANAARILATATVLSIPAALLGGKLADRFSRKKIIIVFDCLTVTLYTVAAILPISKLTILLAFLAGLFQTIETPAYDALNADFSTSAQREKAFSLSYLGFNLGYILGASVSGILFQKYVWLCFLLNGASILVSTVLIGLFVHMKNAVHETSSSGPATLSEYEQPVDDSISVLQVLRQRKVVLLALLIGCFAALPSNVVGILLPLQLKSTMGEYGAAIYGYLNSLNGFVVILCTPVFTILLRKFTEIPKSILGLLLFVAGIALFSVEGAVWVLFVGMFVFTMGEVVSVLGNNPYNSRRMPASHWGRVGGISSVIYSAFSALTQYGIGWILDATGNNYFLLWMVFVVCGLGAAALYAGIYRLDRKTFPLLYRR